MTVLVTSEIKLLSILADLKEGETLTYEEMAERLVMSSSGAHRCMMSLVELECVKLINLPRRRTRYELTDIGRQIAKREAAHTRLARFFREERPDLGFEGDVEGWDPVQCAIENLRRKPRSEEIKHG